MSQFVYKLGRYMYISMCRHRYGEYVFRFLVTALKVKYILRK